MKTRKLLVYCPTCGKDKYFVKGKSEQGADQIRCVAGHVIATRVIDHVASAAVMEQLAPRSLERPAPPTLNVPMFTGILR